MKPMNLIEIEKAVSGSLVQGEPRARVSGVSIDSRTVKEGELFIAIIGERFDGHSFITEAVKKGARALIVDREIETKSGVGIIRVNDTTVALQDLARYYRHKFAELKVIAITGSAGKTTTKDMISTLLGRKFKIRKTPGNLNNYYGLPLTLLGLEGDEDIAVLEMGMSRLGEIRLLAGIARPEIGVITNVGPTHLETLGTIENVARGKSELIEALPEEGTAILNYDDPLVRQMKDSFQGEKVIYYGLTAGADLYANSISISGEEGAISFDLTYWDERLEKLTLNKPGRHNLYNALAAIAVAREFGVDWLEIREGLKSIALSSLRWDVTRLENGTIIINDTYNANPLSMRAAIDATLEIAEERIITVLGAMLELGAEKENAHLELGRYLRKQGVNLLITVGEEGKLIARGALKEGMPPDEVYNLEDNQAAGRLLLELIRPGDTVLIKGSRGVKMEEIVELVLKQGD